jgi:anti-anti-sigma factor
MSETHGGHWLQRQDFGDVTVVRIHVPQLRDDDTTREVFAQIDALVREMGRSRLVLNLAGVQAVLTLGAGKLLMLNRRTETDGGRLALCHLQPVVREVLRALHIDHVFRTYETEAEGIQALSLTDGERARA